MAGLTDEGKETTINVAQPGMNAWGGWGYPGYGYGGMGRRDEEGGVIR